jgi:hypothetical protein
VGVGVGVEVGFGVGVGVVVGVGTGVVVGVGFGVGVAVGIGVGVGVGVGVGTGVTVIDGFGKYLSESFMLLCGFVAVAEIKSTSAPCEIPVICQVAVAVPVGKLLMLTVGELTEKRPFCELNVTETPDS